jgi:hypothetical protein
LREKSSPRRPDDILTLRSVAAGLAFFGHVLLQQHDRFPAQMGTATRRIETPQGKPRIRNQKEEKRWRRGKAARREQILIVSPVAGHSLVEEPGERDRTRTCDSCLKRSCRTKSQRFRRNVTRCDELLQMPCPARLSSDAATVHHTRSGLVVGTKLAQSVACVRTRMRTHRIFSPLQ